MTKELRIKQIIPVHDVWEKFIEEDGSIYYNKAIALAVVDCGDSDQIRYLFRYDIELVMDLDGIQDPANFFFTHEIDPEELKKSFYNPHTPYK